jgi:tape measure domain-containing protein
MPTTIENNVVSMSFDNADFERNAKTTMGTLDKLKTSLDFSKTADSLNEVSDAANRVDMSGLQNGVEEVHNRFSALEVVAFTVLNRITNAAIDAGAKIGRALTIEGMVDGFQEYELTMNSIMTLMNGTGESYERVMAGLNDLNSYADQTIYSFSDMTANITKFTNQGVSLDDSVASMKGIANWAAYAGVGTQQASMAMYNLGQALGRGYVQLIDWRSIMNAGMDTTAFKEQALEVAKQVGTVTDAMIQNYGVQGMFSEALGKENWLTNDVLITTLKLFTDTNTEIGKKATEAATQIKTFTQLMSTIKESIGTGWAETWTYIFGDLDQAKALWTPIGDYISGIIGKMSDARNAIFKGWNLSGGRDNVIAGLADIATTLLDTFGSLSGAFQDVFGGLDAVKLDQFSIAFRNFASTLKEDIAPILPGLRNTFGGLFAVIDIGVTFVTSLGRAFWYLLKNSGLADLAASLFGITGSFGEYIKNVDKTIKRNDTLYKAFKKVADFLLVIPKGINAAFTALTGMGVTDALNKAADALSNFFSTLGSGSSKVKEFFSLFSDSIAAKVDKLKESFSGMGKETGILEGIFKGFASGLAAVANAILDIVTAISSSITKVFGDADTRNMMDFINTAGLAGSLGAFLLQLKNLMDPLDDIGDMITNIREDLAILQNAVKADVIMKIAIAVGVLAASCLLLASIDADRLAAPFAAITGFVAEMSVAFAIMNKFSPIADTFGGAFTGLINSVTQSNQATVLIKMASAVLILAVALKAISSIEPVQLAASMTAITLLLGELVGAAILLSKFGGKIKTGGFLAMANSLLVISAALKIISTIEPGQMMLSLFAITALLAEMTGVMILLNTFGGKINTSGFIAMATSLVLIGVALKAISSIEPEKLVNSLLALTTVLAEMTGAMIMLSSFGGKVSAGNFIAMAASLLLIAGSLKLMADIDGESLRNSVIALSVTLAVLTAALIATAKSMDAKEMTFAAGALSAVMGAIIGLGVVLAKLGELSPGQMATAVIGLGFALAELAVGLNAMKGTIGGAGALLVASLGITALALALKLLSTIPFTAMLSSLAGLAIAIAAFSGAAVLLQPLLIPMTALAGVLVLFGAACALVGAGILALSAGLAMLAVSGVAGATAFVGILSVIMGAIPMIVNAITLFIQTLLQSYITLVPMLVEAAVVTIKAICEALITCIPLIIKTVMTLILALLTTIRDNIQQIVEIGADIVINIIKGITEKLPELINAGFELVIAFIDGLGQAVEDNAAKIREVMIRFGEHLWNAFCNFFGIHSPSTKMKEGGNFLIDGLINGINEKIESVKAKLGELKTAMINKLKERLEDFAERGKAMMSKLEDGAENFRDSLKSKMQSIASSMKDGLEEKYNEFSKAGSYLMEGLQNGIGSVASAVADKAAEIGRSVLAALKLALKEKSPSKATTEMGQFLDQGLINGMENLRKNTTNAAVRVANSVMTALTENLPDLEDEIDGEFNFTPVVKPMIDLTGIQNGASSISDLFRDETFDTILSVKDARESRKDSSNSSKSEGKTVINNVEINQRNESPNPMNTYEMYRNNKKLVEMIEEATI